MVFLVFCSFSRDFSEVFLGFSREFLVLFFLS